MKSLLICLVTSCFLILDLSACQLQSNTQIPTDASAIVGGEAATNGEFPFAVNIWYNSPSDNYVAHLCGASLIAKNWVLTAAHCVLEDESESTTKIVSIKKLSLYLGGLEHSGSDGRLLKIKSIKIHPEFSWPKNDVALIELAESVGDVTPVALNSNDLGNSRDLVTAIGWGLNSAAGTTESASLLKVTVRLKTRAECAKDPFVLAKEIKVGPETLCIQTSEHQKSSCPGDSGGPLLKMQNGKYSQVGIVSWGSACSPRSNIASDSAGYADVSHALPWILKVIQ